MQMSKIVLALLLFSIKTNGVPRAIADEYTDMCDASAALAVDSTHFIIANDEDNTLRIYHVRKQAPVSTFDLAAFLRITYDDKSPESDIEGAAQLGDYYFFITSHGRDKKGRLRRNRHQFFAVRIDPRSYVITPVGRSYQFLMEDMIQLDEFKRLNIVDAFQPNDKKNERLAPKERGVNIEGLAARPDGNSLFIAFRNPVPFGKALLVEFLNPLEVAAGASVPKFGDVFLLDLNGLGVRSLEYNQRLGSYFVIGGASDGEPGSVLYLWDGKKGNQPSKSDQLDFGQFEQFNPEAMAIYQQSDRFQIFSDDGTVLMPDGEGGRCDCKELANPDLKKFRGMWYNVQDLLGQ
ncbi:DUF3616 domain-containing protein [candidate division KSB1 bacterium]|nr:DUF3616 domain-containing protein [candidate division KSB1 bacterium]RQW07000.1 MAG: DUF3616 domain-containing protein [candidate division KSB1 bacterium]